MQLGQPENYYFHLMVIFSGDPGSPASTWNLDHQNRNNKFKMQQTWSRKAFINSRYFYIKQFSHEVNVTSAINQRYFSFRNKFSIS